MSDEQPIATGLCGVAQSVEQRPVKAPVTGSTPVPAATLPDGWTIQRASEFIGDLATNMYDLNYVLAKHEVSRQQYEAIKNNEFFVATLKAFSRDWHKPDSVERRLALKSAIILEDSMPDLAPRLKRTSEPLNGIVELLKLYAKIAGLGEKQDAHKAQAQERFQININLGADTERYEKVRSPTITVAPLPLLLEGAGDTDTVQPVPEGASKDESL